MFSVNSRASAVVALLIAGLFGVVSALFVVPASAEPASTPPAPIFEGFPAPTLVPAVCDASTQGQRVWDSVLPPVAEEGFWYNNFNIDAKHVATVDASWGGYGNLGALGDGWTSTGENYASWRYELPSRMCPGVAPSGVVGEVEAAGYVCDATTTFSYTGEPQSFAVPKGASVAVIEAAGAQGGQLAGLREETPGKGARVTSVISVSGPETLQVRVGGAGQNSDGVDLADLDTSEKPATMYFFGMLRGGFNGGGSASVQTDSDSADGVSGGGASDVRRGSGLNDRLVVAGGGGAGTGGDGGKNGHDGQILRLPDTTLYAPGQTALDLAKPNLPGRGGSQSAGGASGLLRQERLIIAPDDSILSQTILDEVVAAPGGQAGLGVGGSSITVGILPLNGYPTLVEHFGGGGGYYGGGAGGGYTLSIQQGGYGQSIQVYAGAGGGSSYAVPAPGGMPATTFVDGARKGDGYVSITPCSKRVVSPPEVTPTPTPNPGTNGEVLAQPVGPEGKVLKPQKPAKSLPSTGASVYALPAAILAGVLLTAGVVVLVASRRRRES